MEMQFYVSGRSAYALSEVLVGIGIYNFLCSSLPFLSIYILGNSIESCSLVLPEPE